MIKVVTKNFVKEENLGEILEIYKELVDLTRKEKGCIRYELYQDEKNPTILTMIELWESKMDLEEHFKSEHFTRIVPQLKEFMTRETEINVYNKMI